MGHFATRPLVFISQFSRMGSRWWVHM